LGVATLKSEKNRKYLFIMFELVLVENEDPSVFYGGFFFF